MKEHAADVIQTERLRLERIDERDAGLMLAIWNDPDFIRYVGDRGIRTEPEALKAMQEGALKQWSELGYGAYGISKLGETETLGICGLFKRENLDDPDIGYGFLPNHCGGGYAFEAACAVRDHARDVMGLPRICAIVSADNARSIHLLEKLGMSQTGTVRMPDEDEELLLYSIEFG